MTHMNRVAVGLAVLVVGAAVAAAQTRPAGRSLYVHVAVIEPREAPAVGRLLDRSDIPNLIEGSVAYGVAVLPQDRDRAIELLKADAAKRGYWVKFAQPAAAPAEGNPRAQRLKGSLKDFTLRLVYHGDEDKPFYRLLLSVPKLGPDPPSPFFRQAQITQTQAAKIVDRLAADGFFDVALDGNRNRGPLPPKQPYYSLTVRVENGGDPVQYEEWLTFDQPLLRRLDGIRAVLEDEAARGMDLLLGRISFLRNPKNKPDRGQTNQDKTGVTASVIVVGVVGMSKVGATLTPATTRQ